MPRELGAVLIRGTQLRVIIPRVHADRTVAQFRVQAPAVGVGPLCRAVVVVVGVGVLVLARLRSRPTHAWRRRTGAGGLVVAALLEGHRSQAHDGARGGAPRREQQSQARAHQVPAVAAFSLAYCTRAPPNTPVACAASLDTKAVVLRLSPLADNHFSLEYTAPLSAFQALCVALTLCPFSLSQTPNPPSHRTTPTTHAPPNPGRADAPTSASVTWPRCIFGRADAGYTSESVRSKTSSLKTRAQTSKSVHSSKTSSEETSAGQTLQTSKSVHAKTSSEWLEVLKTSAK